MSPTREPRRTPLATLALAALLGAPGCTVFGRGDPVEVREYDLLPEAAAPRAPVASIGTEAALQVEPFGVNEVLEREGIVWRRSDAQVGAYGAYRWARPPQQATREAFAAALRTALAPSTVATDPPLADPDLVLRAYLGRCEEVDRGRQWFGVAEVRVVLLRRDGVELLRKTYAGEERALARNPDAVVEALRRVVGRLAEELASDVRGALANEGRERGP